MLTNNFRNIQFKALFYFLESKFKVKKKKKFCKCNLRERTRWLRTVAERCSDTEMQTWRRS